jgi:hypothetical protein
MPYKVSGIFPWGRRTVKVKTLKEAKILKKELSFRGSWAVVKKVSKKPRKKFLGLF